MKKLLLVLITVLSVILVSTTFYSCEKEEENNNDLPSYPMSFNDDYLEYETIPHTKNCKATRVNKFNNGSIIIPSYAEYEGEQYKVIEIGDNFVLSSYKDSLTGNLIIANTITKIGKYAFFSCQKLKGSIIIPGSVKEIGNYAFYLCTNAKKIELNYGLEKIGDKAFYLSCTNYQNAFILTIPSSVLEIGNEAFNGVEINNVVSSNPIPPKITSNIFGNGFGYIYVPSNAVEVYKNDAGWRRYYSIIYSI